MNYAKTKVYYNGSHYIGIPYVKQFWKKRKKKVNKSENKAKKELNEKITEKYKELKGLTKKEKIEKVAEKIKKEINNIENATEIVEQNLERINRNIIVRKTRFMRKAYLHRWNYFCTFTYDSNKLSEEEFKTKLSNCFRHFANRKGWRYMGVWERSPENQRLHFHGLFNIPEMVGEFTITKDYSTKNHKMQVATQNTYFLERFGRNDFQEIEQNDVKKSIYYMLKYIGKSGEKIVYSKHLETYFVSDILECDIICRCGLEDRKLLLFNDFHCLVDGELIGKVSPEVIEKMPKVN